MDTIQPLYSVTKTALPVLQPLILNPHKHRQNKSPGPENKAEPSILTSSHIKICVSFSQNDTQTFEEEKMPKQYLLKELANL